MIFSVRKHKMKNFYEQKYPCEIIVRVTWVWPYRFETTDAIKGLNPGHALYRARLNWSDADSIELVG